MASEVPLGDSVLVMYSVLLVVIAVKTTILYVRSSIAVRVVVAPGPLPTRIRAGVPVNATNLTTVAPTTPPNVGTLPASHPLVLPLVVDLSHPGKVVVVVILNALPLVTVAVITFLYVLLAPIGPRLASKHKARRKTQKDVRRRKTLVNLVTCSPSTVLLELLTITG